MKSRKVRADYSQVNTLMIILLINYHLLFFVVRRVQNLYESLVETNDSIYCQRVKEMYTSEPLKTHLFSVNLQQTYLLLISDTTMLGRDNLMIHLQDIDNLRLAYKIPHYLINIHLFTVHYQIIISFLLFGEHM